MRLGIAGEGHIGEMVGISGKDQVALSSADDEKEDRREEDGEREMKL